jgi:hypothetical protein
MTARTKQSSVLSENPKLMISMGSMCDQYKFAVHDADERYLGDVTAKSKRYALATAKVNGMLTASKVYKINR